MILFTKNNCAACSRVKLYLSNSGYGYEEVNIEENPDAARSLVDAGVRTVPTVRYGSTYLIGLAQIQEML